MICKTILTILFTILLMNETALACQPCTSTLNLEQSLKKADLVIVGRRMDHEPNGPPYQTSTVAVFKVLKGTVIREEVLVRGWHGMCPYGIIVNDKTYLMILQVSSEISGAYEAVDSGCSVKTLPVQSGVVSIEGKRLSLEKFKRRYKL